MSEAPAFLLHGVLAAEDLTMPPVCPHMFPTMHKASQPANRQSWVGMYMEGGLEGPAYDEATMLFYLVL